MGRGFLPGVKQRWLLSGILLRVVATEEIEKIGNHGKTWEASNIC
jgi:hypothetical protein